MPKWPFPSMGRIVAWLALVAVVPSPCVVMAQDIGTPPQIGLPPTQPPEVTLPPGQPADGQIEFLFGGISASLYAYVDAGYLDPGMELGIKLMRAEPQGAIAVACTEAWVDAIPQWAIVRAGDTWICAQAERYTHYLIILRGLDERRYTDVYFKMCVPQRGGDWEC